MGYEASISPDGEYVVYTSEVDEGYGYHPYGINPVYQAYAWQKLTGWVVPLSVDANGDFATADCCDPAVSGSDPSSLNQGYYAAFDTWATNLIPNPPADQNVYYVDDSLETLFNLQLVVSPANCNAYNPPLPSNAQALYFYPTQGDNVKYQLTFTGLPSWYPSTSEWSYGPILPSNPYVWIPPIGHGSCTIQLTAETIDTGTSLGTTAPIPVTW